MSQGREVVMSEEHEALLKTVLQIEEERSLPQKVLDMYGEFKISLDRLGVHNVSMEMLALIPILLNRVARPEPRTFFDEVQEHGEVKYGTRVVAKYRGKWQAARFNRLTEGKVVVVLDDDTAEERKLGPTAVKLATADDLKKLGEDK